MKKISAIIFDFGGVLSSDDDLGDIGKYLAKKYQVPTKILNDITWRGWKKARINPKHDFIFWREVAEALGISEKRLHAEYLAFPKFLPEVARLVRASRKRYIVGMLSNQIATWHQTLMKRWRLQKSFDLVVTSYGEGIAKPDSRIYKRLIQKIGLPPEECVYVDDREYNLPPAKKLGMRVIRFKNPKQLLRELKKLGVEF